MKRFWSAVFILLNAFTVAAQQPWPLGSGSTLHWQFRQAGDSLWLPATVPGCVHTDLLANGRIPDPFYGDNENKAQRVEQKDWEYRLRFDAPPGAGNFHHCLLQFAGLDTYADVYLNDSLLLHADNQFRKWNADVKNLLREKDNILFIHFFSAVNKGKQLAAALGYLLPGDDGGKALERKAQYQFGWDWGPRLVTCGIWQPVTLISYNDTLPDDGERRLPIPPDEKPKLIQQKDAAGSSFYFTVEGQPLFIKGANLIPLDNFLSRVTAADYRHLVDEALAAHMNMLRVWGGGAYLPDSFYDYCDEKGMLVWQDFMFAGAMVPGDTAFVNNVKQEAIEQVQRLSRHRCIALWCGNNEINEAWHNWGYRDQNKSASVNQKIWNDYLHLFDTLLPQVVHTIDPGRAYLESSPKFGWGHPESLQQGDAHYWGVWWGGEPFSAYETHVGRFMSEYGFQSFPSMDALYAFATPGDWRQLPLNRQSAGAVLNTHEKHQHGFELIHDYLQRDYHVPQTFEQYVYVSQLVQRDGMATAIEAHRRARPYCMGTLYWQLNDCWPVTSWSSIDYTGQWKALHYALAHDLYRTFLISIKEENDTVNVWVVSDSAATVTARLKLDWIAFDGKEMTPLFDSAVTIAAQASRLLLRLPAEKFHAHNAPRNHLLHAVLTTGDETVATKDFFFTKPKDLILPDPHLTSTIRFSRMASPYKDFPVVYTIVLHADAFAKDVFLSYDFETVKFSDNFFNLLPGEERTLIMYAQQAIDQVNHPVKVWSLFDAQ